MKGRKPGEQTSTEPWKNTSFLDRAGGTQFTEQNQLSGRSKKCQQAKVCSRMVLMPGVTEMTAAGNLTVISMEKKRGRESKALTNVGLLPRSGTSRALLSKVGPNADLERLA
jgi:hypothetical protein